MILMFLNRILGSILFISGTSIGAGMLGLPIKTIGINVNIVFLTFFIVWIFMLCSSISMLEISMWLSDDTNIISISNFVCGKYFSFFIGFLYILFLYALIAAYISGGSNMLIDILAVNCDTKYCSASFCVFFILPFFMMILLGFNFADYVNRFFFILLIFLYLFITLNLSTKLNININKFYFLDSSLIFFSLPIVLTSFGYSLLIPSLKSYLFNNKIVLVFSIIVGSGVPFLVYIIWEYFIYSFLFNISNKLFMQTLFGYGNPAEKLMILIGNNDIFILYVISSFSLSALIGSLIGVALSLYDFLFDLFSLSKNVFKYRFFSTICVFFIPLFLSIFYRHGFMFFLSYAGAIAAILLVIFPVYVLWYGRYVRKFNYVYIMPGNRSILFFLLFFGFLVCFVDFFYNCFI